MGALTVDVSAHGGTTVIYWGIELILAVLLYLLRGTVLCLRSHRCGIPVGVVQQPRLIQ